MDFEELFPLILCRMANRNNYDFGCRSLNRRRSKPPVNADVRAGDEAAGCVRCEEHRRADQFLGAAKAIHGRVGEDLLAALGWGVVFFKEQAAVLLREEEAWGDGVDPHSFVHLRICTKRRTFVSHK